MRLLTKTTLYFLLVMIPLLAIGGIYLFYQVNTQLNEKADQELVGEEILWIRFLQKETGPDRAFVIKNPMILIHPVDTPGNPYPDITDTKLLMENDEGKITFRQLSHTVTVNSVFYNITIRKSLAQKTILLTRVIRIMLIVFLVMFIASILFNRMISKKLWQPFKRSLEKIRGAELSKMEAIKFEQTNTKEFNELNGSLNLMTARIYDDYVNMKEFTENAAHEMQTPLAVAQSKLELLLQDNNLTDDQVNAIMQGSEALLRLSKLNQSLLLLARIENSQFETKEPISLTATTKKYLLLFDEIIKDKKVTVATNFNEDWQIPLHPLLAETLVSNLVGNAVKYNYPGGKLVISINENMFVISNTSLLPEIQPGRLFSRFYKPTASNDFSNGLGLAIVKKIADTHNIKIKYEFTEGLHSFRLEPKENNAAKKML